MNLEELKAKAQAATPGPWMQGMFGKELLPEVDRPGVPGFVLANARATPQAVADAAFIAAANPQIVLALVKVVEGISFLHVPDQYGACLGCGSNESGYAIVTWPCETAAIIEELEGEE